MIRWHLFRPDPYGFCRRCGNPFATAAKRHITWLAHIEHLARFLGVPVAAITFAALGLAAGLLALALAAAAAVL